MAIETHDTITNLSNKPDIGFQYQENGTPWASIIGAHNGVPEAYHAPGKIRFIDQGDGKGVIEYWYRGGIALENLVPRYENLESAAAYVETLEGIKAQVETLKSETETLKDESLNAAQAAIEGIGTFNAATGTAIITETGVSFTPTSTSNQPNGKFFDITVGGSTAIITGTPIPVLVGGRIISRGTKWDYIPYEIGHKSIGTDQIVNKSISPELTNFIDVTKNVGKNLFNKNQDFLANSRISPTTGLISTASNYTNKVSGLIPIFGATSLAKGQSNNNYVLLGADGITILGQGSAWGTTNGPITNTLGATFIRIQIDTTHNINTLQIESGTAITGYADYVETHSNKLSANVLVSQATDELKADIRSGVSVGTTGIANLAVTSAKLGSSAVTEIKISNGAVTQDKVADGAITGSKLADKAVTKAKASFINPVVGKNKIDPAVVDMGKYLSSTGILLINALYNTTGFIPASPGDVFTGSNLRYAAFYDASQSFIPGSYAGLGSNAVSTLAVAPANTAYFKVSGLASAWATAQVEPGLYLTAYEPYVKTDQVDENVKISGKNLQGDLTSLNPILINLAPEYCVAVGRTIEIYHKQIAWTGNISNYHFFWSGVGKSMKRKWSLTGTTIGTNILTLKVYDNRMVLVASATTVIRVVSNVIPTPFTATAIADSLGNNKPWYTEITALSAGQITFVGTRGTTMKHEGRSGATASYYLGNNSYTFDTNGQTGNDGRAQNLNPFWNPSTSAFDFAYYKSNYNQNPGRVIIWLGTNGIGLDPAVNVNAIKAIVDGIRAVDATIKIYVVNTLFRGDQNGIGVQTGSDGFVANTSWKLEEDRKVFNLKVALNAALSAYTNLYMVPVADCHDSEFNFGDVATPVNPRAAQTEPLPIEATHPQLQGYLQIADIIFSSFAAHL